MNNSEVSQLCNDYKISEDELRLWLTVREIRAAGEVVRKGLEPREVRGFATDELDWRT